MFNIKLYNSISEKGTDKLSSGLFSVSDEIENPHGIVLRSYKMQDSELEDTVLGIARAGAGVNNIPVDKASEKGIVVFNTPGANANAVAELVVCSLFLSSRKIVRSIGKIAELKDDPDVGKKAEKLKSEFAGPEVSGKTLGLIGLGAIGSKVANYAQALGMNVVGYDPFLTVDNAISLSRNVELAKSMDAVIEQADYLTLHLPVNDETTGFINDKMISKMKDNVRILNFARGEIVDNKSMVKAVKSGKVARYVCDFAAPEIMGVDNIIVLPHLGASTPEAEDNCAIMACDQLNEYLTRGNIINSVNFPQVRMERVGENRMVILNKNISGIVEKVTHVLSEYKVNISEMVNKSKKQNAVTVIDTDEAITDKMLNEIGAIEGIIRVRKV